MRPVDAVLALVLLPSLVPPSTAAEMSKRFGSVAVSCDAESYCAATLPAKGEAATASRFVLMRSADRRARWWVMLSTPGALANGDRAMSLSIDNSVDITLRPGSDFEAFVQPGDFYLQSQSALDRLMLQIQNGHVLRFAYIDVAGAPHTELFQLDGFAQALSAIDAEQNHIIGDRRAGPPSGLPAAASVDAPAVIAEDGVPPRLAAWHAALGDCEAMDSPAFSARPPLIASLSDTATLYALPCFASAAGLGYRLYSVERGEIGGMHRMLFAGLSAKFGWFGAETVYDATFDAKAKDLDGVLVDDAGCRIIGRWTWDDFAFRLDRLERAPGCSAAAGPLYPAN